MDAATLMLVIQASDQASAVIKHVEDSSTSLGNTLSKITNNALGFAGGLAVAAGAGSAFDALGGVIVGFNSKLEQSTISWKTFTGNADAAAAVLQQVQQIAATTPFEFNDVDRAAKRFVNAGFSAQQALDFVKPLSNAVASVGLGAEGVDRVSLALAQMTAKGKVSGEEMLQLAEAQIPAWQILADATGKPIPELQKLVTQGKISAQQFTDAFSSFYGDTGRFADAAHDQSLTLQGSLSTIKDELNIVGSTAFQPLFKALSDGARALAAFVQSDQFTVWGARVQAVVGLIVDGLGSLAGAFYNTLGGVLNIVNSVGQAIYTGLQWLNPFAPHSPPLVSQVQDGVAAIESAYSGLGGLTSTFDGIGASFESLAGKTADFSATVDGTTLKTQSALAVLGPGVTQAFHEASDAVDTAKVSLGDIKEAWDTASDALAPLKDNLGATKDALNAQKDALGDLQSQLSDAKAAFDPLNDALKDAKQNASDAESAIRSLTTTPIAGTADFDKKISDANIALKQQSLELSNVKQSTAFQSLGDQIDTASAKLKEMQRAQSAAPNLPAGATAQQRAAASAASDAARAAISQQQAGIDSLKAKQADLIAPAQKKLDLDRIQLDTINLQKDATIGVAQEQIKQAALAAQGIKEQTQAQIQAGIAAAGAQKAAATAQVDKLTPQVAAQQAVIDGLTGKIHDQQHAVEAAQKATDAASQTYSDAKEKVDDLGTAYRDTKAQVAAYEQQLKSTIAAGDTQVQKIKAAAAEAKKAAAAAGAGPAAAKVDVLAGLDIEGSKAKIKAFSDQVASTRASVTGNLDALRGKWDTVWSSVKTVLDRVLAGFGGFKAIQPAIDFLQRFGVVAAALVVGLAGVGAVTSTFLGALAPFAPALAALLTPMGLLIVGIAALATVWTLNIGNIQQSAGGLAAAFAPLQAIPAIVEQALSGDVLGAFSAFVTAVGEVRTNLLVAVAGWAGAFFDWALPLLPGLLAELEKIGTRVVGWVLDYGAKLTANVIRWGDAFIGWILPRIPGILATLETLATSLFGWVRTQVPRIINSLGQWATAFVQWVIPLLPQLLASLEVIANQIIAWIRTGVPQLLGALVEWAGAFIQWIAPLIPDILGALAGLLGEIIRWSVEEGLPAIVGTIGDWGGAFIGWIGPRIGPMLEELAKIADALGKWINDRLPEIGDQIGKWGAAFVDWVGTTVLPVLGPALDQLINGGSGFVGIVPWIKVQADALPENLAFWVTAFTLWVDDVKNALPKKMDELGVVIAEWAQGPGGKAVAKAVEPLGQAMLDGVLAGLRIGVPGFYQAIGDSILSGIPDMQAKIEAGMRKALGLGTKANEAPARAPSLADQAAAVEAAASNIPVSSDSLTNPLKLGGQRGGPGTIPQIVGGFLTQEGMTADQIAAFCGPLAAEAIATGLGKGVDIPTLVQTALRNGWTAAAGQGGFINFQAMLNALGVPTIIENMQDAIATLGKGIPVAISTPLHYFLATGLDEAGKLIVGESGKVFRGGAAALTLQQIQNLGGAIQAFITPAFQNGGDAISTFGGMLGDLGQPASQLSQTVAGLGGDFDTFAAQSADAADALVNQFGISLDQATAILNDHGKVAQDVLGTMLPGSFALADSAVGVFADAFGVSLGQARDILTAGGDVATAVLGQQIPDAAQATVDAVSAAGSKDIWDNITSNAAIAGKSLADYLAGTGVSSINLATASLVDLQKASGLSLPQMQRMAEAAGKDLRTWLRDTGVPAADALRISLGPTGLAGTASNLQSPVNDAKNAIQSLARDGFDFARGSQADLARDIATQVSFVLQQLSEKMPALNEGIRQFIGLLGQIPRDIAVNIRTTGATNLAASAGGGGGGSSSGGGGSSGSGGGFSQADLSNQSTRADLRNQGYQVGQNSDGSYYAEKRAAGGALSPNKPYLAGERGMELIFPSAAGMVHHTGASAAIADAMANWPSTQTLNSTASALSRLQRSFSALPRSVQVKATVQADSAAAGLQRGGYAPRPATGSGSTGGIDYDKLADKIGSRIAREMQNAPAPTVAVEEIRSKLIAIGTRNGGIVGLA